MNPVTPSLTPINPANGKDLTLNVEPLTVNTFTPGQLIKATVQQVINSVIWLKSEGQTLQARTQLPLQPGQEVWLKVAEVSPQRVNLQLQTLAPNPDLYLPGQSTAGIETLLTTWGIEADDINLTIARTLLAQVQMINPDDIQTIRALGQTWISAAPLDGGGEKQLEALTYLYANQLPISDESLALARLWLSGLPALTERLADLQLGLDEALRQLSHLEPGRPAFDQLHHLLSSVRSQLANGSILPGRPIAEVIAALTHLTIQLGTPPEAELLTSPSVPSSLLLDPSAGVTKESAGGALPFPIPFPSPELGEGNGGAGGLAKPLACLAAVLQETLSQANFNSHTA